MTDLDELITLSKKNLKPASIMLSRAFQNDPLIRWQIPEINKRLMKIQNYWEFYLRIGLKYGKVYATSKDLEGIAIWRPPSTNISYWNYLTNGIIKFLFKFGIKNTKKITFVQAVKDSIRNIFMKGSYWYLQLIAVDPIHQGKGFASTLLKPMLNRIDKKNLPIWLETNLKKNVTFFDHFDFSTLEEIIIPNTNLVTWFMIRYSGL
ncbi:MAG: GNAT family N-acetyltransferase [Candidatus Thorarchaeota archaeon]